MRRAALPVVALLLLLVGTSVLLAGLAASAALARDDVGALDTDLASLIRADYSVDGYGAALERLDGRIIEAARRDDERLFAGASDIEIVPAVRNVPAEPPDEGGSPPLTDVPDIGDTPTPGETPQPGRTPVPGETPRPGATPEPGETPTPAPGDTPTPTPGVTPTPTPAPTPTPLPASGTYYLHNYPTPPSSDTSLQSLLSFDTQQPTVSTLYNYDIDHDGQPGRTIDRGGSGAAESDPLKYQAWQGPLLNAAMKIDGTVTVQIWGAMNNFALNKAGAATVYLRDCAGSNCVTIAQSIRSEPNWQGSDSTWKPKAFSFSIEDYTVQSGHRLEIKLIVQESSADDLMFAYDTVNYKARLIFS